MALTSGLQALTVDDIGTAACKRLTTTPLREEETAVAEPNRSWNSKDEKKMEAPQKCASLDASPDPYLDC
ncbi:hypothetical protein N7489_004849 [Penicillium chrysogenum]|jgi:hypothetical protein|uniref:uncharacterized protein n=1 Tax=Penicillium chrysogenum TaxID=5076 RepID=UPI0024DF1B7F|nr:uncharacterized protein N7489_004849 [Penicillium chrysogenum]KAJ5244753.1 hypothetical protein N7489_004849 [Penicillium chrysogenum]